MTDPPLRLKSSVATGELVGSSQVNRPLPRITMTVDSLEIDAGDRILSLSVPPAGTVRSIAARLKRGGFVALGSRDEVLEARRAVRDLPNVIFHPGPPEEIPFENAYFTRIVDFRCDWSDAAAVAREISRVLVDGGHVHLRGGDAELLTAAGLLVLRRTETTLVLKRSDRSARGSSPRELPVLR